MLIQLSYRIVDAAAMLVLLVCTTAPTLASQAVPSLLQEHREVKDVHAPSEGKGVGSFQRGLQHSNSTINTSETPSWCGTIGVAFGVDSPPDFAPNCSCAMSPIDESTIPPELSFEKVDVDCTNNCATCFENGAFCGFIDLREGYVNDEQSDILFVDETCITYESGESGRLCVGSNVSATTFVDPITECYVKYNDVLCSSCQYLEETVDGSCLIADCTNVHASASFNTCTETGFVGPFRTLAVLYGFSRFAKDVTVGTCKNGVTVRPMAPTSPAPMATYIVVTGPPEEAKQGRSAAAAASSMVLPLTAGVLALALYAGWVV